MELEGFPSRDAAEQQEERYWPTTTPATDHRWWNSLAKKYVILCMICGGLTVLLGIILIAIYFTLRSYTSSLQFFETIPTYVPAGMLIVTGVLVMCFARRRNRFTYLIKLAGGCCLVCALLCVVITVTTTVVHMNRLQTLHECVYTPKTRSCMCVAAIGDPAPQDAGGHRFVFNHTPNCEVVHGSLYACLRGLFGLSVIGILVCIFSSMLVYQLLGHEKKKVYLEQLELRRRFLSRRQISHQHCGCYDDLYNWHIWEMMFQYPPHVVPEELFSHHRGPPTSWDWFPWLRYVQTREINEQRGFVRRIFSRNLWNFGSARRRQEMESTWTREWRRFLRSRPTPPMRISAGRLRNARLPPNGNHRRNRSNDGVFLHMNPPNVRYPPPLFTSSPEENIPHCMWGPPPPYSQPPSVENLTSHSTEVVATQQQSMDAIEPAPAGHSSKLSSPISERRFLCHNFSSEGITLTIGGGGDYPEVCNSPANLEGEKKEDKCIVHVPYIINNKKEMMFNTLPARSSKKKVPSFKSLSNIPMTLGGRNMYYCPLGNITHFTQHKSILCDNNNIHLQPLVEQDSDEDSYQRPTVVAVPASFRSSLVMSSPSTEQILTNLVYAQSMPNLSLSSAGGGLPRALPSSADTSTSQDIANMDLEEYSSLNGTPVKELPVDNVLDRRRSGSDCGSLGASFLVHSPPPPDNAGDSSCVDKVICDPPASFANETLPMARKKKPSVCNCEPRHYPCSRAPLSSSRDSFIVTIKSVNV